jgi:hypothetical protein
MLHAGPARSAPGCDTDQRQSDELAQHNRLLSFEKHEALVRHVRAYELGAHRQRQSLERGNRAVLASM